MKKIIIALFSLVILSLMSTFAVANTTIASTSATATANNTQYLFVLLSKHASIQLIDKQTKKYQLILKGVNPEVVYFSDRPIRESGHRELSQFITHWTNGSFKENPPNAVMEAVRLNVIKQPIRTVSYAIVLKNPQYNAAKNELQFDISPLPGNPATLPDLAHSDYVALFIDNFCWTC